VLPRHLRGLILLLLLLIFILLLLALLLFPLLLPLPLLPLLLLLETFAWLPMLSLQLTHVLDERNKLFVRSSIMNIDVASFA
jgi:hypothetical protein